jgi:hypothetical protein
MNDGPDDSNGSPSAGEQGPESTESTAEELARMQAELDTLHEELESVKGSGRTGKRRFRRAVVAVLVVLSCLLVVLSTTVVWAHRTVLNTDTFVATVGPVFEHPEVDTAVATRATDQLFVQLHLQIRLKDALPDKVSFAAGPITNATKGYVSAQLAKVLGSGRFQKIWIGTLTSTHQELVAVLRGHKTQSLSTSGGYIVLNTVPVINNALGQVSGLASSLTGQNVKLPTITSAEVPQAAVNKLSKALGVQLPSNFGQITLVRSKNLDTVQRGVKAFDRLVILLPLITLLLIALSLWLSVSRRRTLVQLLVGTTLLMIILRRVVIHEQGALASKANSPQVAQLVLGDLLHGFFVLTAWILGIAVALLVLALLSGPYRWAVAFRSFFVGGWRTVVAALSGERRQRGLAWASSHADALQLGGAVLAAILLFIVSVSWLSFIIIGVLLLVYEVFLQRLKAGRSDGPPPVSAPSTADGPHAPVG